ncbi:Glycosyltransferase, catalytic subunit of cellulose synthase and poly-beta-1,6-N-acetylglucosamine synthase [Jannaschia faecimaris]|uniref:Glycosyltransferase, catalytic subunit of cellulose synthase and poly-beta-1,6-N-acetylglucosamine synthase n=1 Tax=Jannaschia faecimaris TaxID=1244108 RepID=A0A1H3QEF4_9RHOB|nr:glycosyltransferase family 2 protein [Jannaschia faecimaris]SDZ11099.1 Glycosyltransferase, catalytic subunit of cellulose synthase and poly-beta-1,6-N-acetylglucosamine synthase [Jannaschia faecimaris]
MSSPPSSQTTLHLPPSAQDEQPGVGPIAVRRPRKTHEATVTPGPLAVTARRSAHPTRPKLGEVLLDMGVITGSDLANALMIQRRMSARLGDVLLRTELISEDVLADALAQQRGISRAGPPPESTPAIDALARKMPLETALRYRALPWKRVGSLTLVATARPEGLDDLAEVLPDLLGPCLFAVVTDSALDARLQQIHGKTLARNAECQLPRSLSCRQWAGGVVGRFFALLALLACLVPTAIWPIESLRLATAIGLLVMCSNLGLRLAAVIALRRKPSAFFSVPPTESSARKLPSISILVPLDHEPGIAAPLTERLSRLDYPRELLDICLVVEEDDHETRAALTRENLPGWMRIVTVPDGHPRTKPRAMNYALNFTRGEIIGIYDAEDAPAPDQLTKVAARFKDAPPDVVCLQGRLDYYNPDRNWMSRCFTIEYANWFRLMLPGLARLGLPVPLGGTTLFVRREALKSVGGWDAHNVTEDADLGVRLARMGYRTEILQTTTLEEANAHPIAWVKQRSRWMKGYMLTWAVHARHPLSLWRDLGPRRWLGFNLLFMGATLNALLMPALWSTVVMFFGVHHPIMDWLPGDGRSALGLILIGGTLLSMGLTWIGCSARHHRHLRRWIPTMELYFPLATIAAIKALIEIVTHPFHWDKTDHGAFGGTESTGVAALEQTVRQLDNAPSTAGHLSIRS